jgi:type I restriction enzyme S subunit
MPIGWGFSKLGDVVSPRSGKAHPSNHPKARFIGMEHVEAHTMRLLGEVPASEMKSAANVFKTNDVLYGRLRAYLNKVYQPDFEGLCSGEFIVLPESEAICGRFLKYRLNAGDFVSFATHINTGDRPRVDFEQIKVFPLLLPPKPEQLRIADALDELLSDLDAGMRALKSAQAKLAYYRDSVLKAAVQGDLTAEWRKEHPDVEPAAVLLQRILKERRQRWEQEQLRKFKVGGKTPPGNWKGKYEEPVAPDTANLPSLPNGWSWASAEQLCDFITKGTTPSGADAPTSHVDAAR